MFEKYTERLHKKYPINGETWFKVGGCLDFLFEPDNMEELLDVLNNFEGKVTVIGACSNVLIRDGGIRGLCVRLLKMKSIKDCGNLISVDAGNMNSRLVSFAKNNSLSGFEFLAGIPGTIGAGVKMNAGCFGSEFKDIVHSITIIDDNKNIKQLTNEEICFSYRKSSIQENWIVTNVFFNKKSGEREEIEKHILEIIKKKTETQPYGLTCGCAFKNTKSYSAGQLIDQCGLKGHKIQGAFISEKHANFIMNDGSATSADIENLLLFIKDSVYEKFGVNLELEIKILGEN